MRFYGRVEMRHDDAGRLIADWVDTRTVIGLPYDSFIVGHRTDTVNTLRLWAARASRDFDLQLFNEGDYRARGRGEDRHREHLQGPLPERSEP